MKHRHAQLLFATILTITISAATYFTASSLDHVNAAIVSDPEVTLILPDRTETIKLRDLPRADSPIVIPTTDNTPPRIAYDANHGTVSLLSSPQDYVIPQQNFGTDTVITPSFTMRPRFSDQLAEYNKKLNVVIRSELIVKLKDGNTFTDLVISPNIIRQIIMPTSLDTTIPLSLDEPVFLQHVYTTLTPKQQEYLSVADLVQNTKIALNSRFVTQTTPVVLGVDDGPTSHGELSSRYIEVDLSQQKMYFFIGNQLHKSYDVSTGGEYPTPVGEYHILNKATLAFSGIYNVWMPYWMAFAYAGDVGAYLGVHEIAYARDELGKSFYRYGDYIGEKMTGGCIALSPGDSKEVYNLSDVGMLIRVVP